MNYNEQYKPISSSVLRKQMALLSFKDALQEQRFEECSGLVAEAKRLGAGQRDIRKAIADYVRGGTEASRWRKVKAGRKRGRRF